MVQHALGGLLNRTNRFAWPEEVRGFIVKGCAGSEGPMAGRLAQTL